MIKDYYIVDNFFDNATDLVTLAKENRYFTNETYILPGLKLNENERLKPYGRWRGFRTASINSFDPHLHDNIMQKIIQKTFCNYELIDCEASTFFHFSSHHIKFEDNWWHADTSDKKSVYAGVIYLTPNLQDIPGTLLKINENNIVVKYKFNRMLIYKSDILHRPGCTFGDTLDNARLTLTFFINSLDITTRKNYA